MWSRNIDMLLLPQSVAMGYRVYVTVHSAANLPKVDTFGSADPYVSMTLVDTDPTNLCHGNCSNTQDLPTVIAQHKTQIVKNNLHPMFEESFIFEHSIIPDRNIVHDLNQQDVYLLVSVTDWNRIHEDEFLGKIAVKLRPGMQYERGSFVLHDLQGQPLKANPQPTITLTISYPQIMPSVAPALPQSITPTRVAESPKNVEQPAPVSLPLPVPESVPAPAPVQAPVTVPDPQPAPVSSPPPSVMKAFNSASLPVPKHAPLPVPQKESTPPPAPAPEPEPEPVRVPEPAPAPAPVKPAETAVKAPRPIKLGAALPPVSPAPKEEKKVEVVHTKSENLDAYRIFLTNMGQVRNPSSYLRRTSATESFQRVRSQSWVYAQNRPAPALPYPAAAEYVKPAPITTSVREVVQTTPTVAQIPQEIYQPQQELIFLNQQYYQPRQEYVNQQYYFQPQQEVVQYRQEYFQPQQEVVQYRQEYFQPQQEVVQYRQEYFQPQQEVVQYRQEYFQPQQEVVQPAKEMQYFFPVESQTFKTADFSFQQPEIRYDVTPALWSAPAQFLPSNLAPQQLYYQAPQHFAAPITPATESGPGPRLALNLNLGQELGSALDSRIKLRLFRLIKFLPDYPSYSHMICGSQWVLEQKAMKVVVEEEDVKDGVAVVALYFCFAVSGMLGGALFNAIGPRLLVGLGGTTYAGYAMAAYLAGGLLGIGAGCFWTAQGAIMMAYAPAHK
ncbi:hypothetical protein GUITHDRAFT_148823, partial [Guillardia theta CCMP2712]